MFINRKFLVIGFILIAVLFFSSCAPGNERWDQNVNPGNLAGFWVGVWHGFIIIITFIVSLFTKEIGLYEISNTGWPYNLGFIIGLFLSIGGGLRLRRGKKIHKHEWDKIGDKIEEKVRQGLKSWVEETEKQEKKKEWEEIANKIEERIKRVLKDWAEKE